MTEKKIEVFQDLHLKGTAALESIRSNLLAKVRLPWRHDLEREEDLRDHAGDDEDVIVFVRDVVDDIDEAALVLWQDGAGYKVSNIVPRNVGELGIRKYNAILCDFATRIAEAAAPAGGFSVELSSSYESLDDWMDSGPADALRRFSHLANKSTGATHPRDKERWQTFLIAAHRASRRLDTDQLERWLIEVDGWSGDPARELVLEYEFALGLLDQYDRSQS